MLGHSSDNTMLLQASWSVEHSQGCREMVGVRKGLPQFCAPPPLTHNGRCSVREDMHTCRSPGTTMAAGTLPAECRCLVYFPKKLAPGSPDFLSGPLVRSVEDKHGGVGGSPSHLLGLYSVLDPQPRRGLSVPS